MFSSSKSTSIDAVKCAVVIAFSLATVAPVPVSAQGYCAQYLDTLLDTSDDCVNEPWRERSSDVETFSRDGNNYVVINRGNEFSIHNINNPRVPVHEDSSSFNFGTRGDSDYDMVDFDVCDGCRYGVLNHKLQRTVIFDLGAGAPDFGAYYSYDATESVAGGYMFLKGGQHYLIAAGIPGDGCLGSALYEVNTPSNIEELECLEVGGAALTVKGLQTITGVGDVLYLYVGAPAGQVHVYRADGGVASPLTLAYIRSPGGMFGRRQELAIDGKNDLAASANYNGDVVGIWDFSSPDDPVPLYNIPVTAGTVSLKSAAPGAPSTLMSTTSGWANSTRTYIVENTGYDDVVDELFWTDTDLPHNDLPGCAFATGGALSPDGSALYLSRYAVHQYYDFTECLTPTPPFAQIAITPSEPFPGDTVTVRDVSTGRIDSWALWITDGPDPDDPRVAGNRVLSDSNPRTITFNIPQALLGSNDYWAHVELQSDDFPPGDDDYTKVHIDVDRSPTVTISVDPDTVIVTESVDLSAAVNGGTPDSYEWEIRAPGVASGDGDIYPGQEVNSLSLDVSGTWIFDVAARYDHEDPDGPALYEATASYNQTVSSVAANFSISPSTPLHNQVITLNGSSSQPIGGNLGFSWDIQEEGGPGSYDDCPSAAVCTIPAETLEMETAYHVTLTVTNEDVPGDPPSSKMIRMYVGNGNVNPSITFSPSNPERGENVTFHIEGVPIDLDRATWTLGGTGCDGASSSQVCEPGLFNDCKALAFKYSSSGTKTVRLTVEIDDVTYPEVTASVPVAASGDCDVPQDECEFNLGRSNVEFGPAGGESAVTVNTTAGCEWTAATGTPWITVVAPTGEVSGTGTLRFSVPENTGPYRGGNINAGGETLAVYQQAPYVAANFTMSNPQPEIGEVVTVTVDPILEVVSWNFGQADCRDNDPQINCLFLPSGACNTFQWAFPTAGEKSITMVLSDGRTQTKNPTVVPVGECCLADGRPDADFAMSANEAFTGETVAFTDLSSKAAFDSAKALGFSWSPTNPEIGENILFSLSGVVGDVARATWSLGGDGCAGASSTQVCEAGLFNDCKAMSFRYATFGAKSVSVSVELEGGGTELVGPNTVTVANAGSCDSGTGGGCSYALSSTTQSFDSTGGTGSFNVTTAAECEWTATTSSSSWVDITSDSGIGSGTVNYDVDLNPYTSNRAATIQVEGKNHRVSQAGDAGDTAPDEWRWTITRVEDEEGLPMDEDVHTSSDPDTSFTFKEPGRYRVVLTAINCYGSDTKVSYVEIEESPVENFVVAAAISSGGANGTQWESDFRFFNPCDNTLDVSLVFQPDNQDNSAKQLSSYPFSLGPNETMVFPNVREVVEAEEEDAINGSILIDSVSASGCKVLSVSRTFNDTPDGTLGLFVPAMPVTSIGVETLNLTGLISNDAYRSNLRLVNHGDVQARVKITVFHKSGAALNAGRSVWVKSHSTKQLNDVADWAGVDGALSQFTVLAEVKTEGAIVDGFATVIDNSSGDSVMNSSSYLSEPVIWLPGVVHGPGKNDTLWQTDIWFHNPEPTNDWLASGARYIHGKDVDINHVFEYPNDWPAVEAMGMRRRLGIAGSILDDLGLESTSGYMIFEGLEQENAPQISARTYTSDDSGGTYGLHLPAFGPKDLLQVGEVGYIVGVSNSADDLTGFRTNLGLLATGRTAEVEVTFFYPDGSQAPEPWITKVWAGQSKQINNVFGKFGLGNETVTGTFRIEVLSGGNLIIYATEIDNQIGDSIFIPAQQKYMGLAR